MYVRNINAYTIAVRVFVFQMLKCISHRYFLECLISQVHNEYSVHGWPLVFICVFWSYLSGG